MRSRGGKEKRYERGDKAVWVWPGGGKLPSSGEICRIALASLADEYALEIPAGAFERQQPTR